MDNPLSLDDTVAFDWDQRWLTGQEYFHMLRNRKAYCRDFGFEQLAYKTHPEDIYLKPQNGKIYFVAGSSIKSDFGFPRVEMKKKFRWKKMNFTTDLPKRSPIVSYIVASAVRCEKQFSLGSTSRAYRMHAVILAKDPQYILCHIREISESENVSRQPARKIKATQKRLKRSPLCPIEANQGIECLLDAVELIRSPVKSIPIESKLVPGDEENDYIAMHKKLSKFEEFDEEQRPTFQIIRP